MTTTTIAPRPGSLRSIWDLCYNVVVNHYADFSGTATRREFWTFYLARLITGLVATVIPFVGVIFIFGTLVPALAIATRRLHEIGRSGWWQLLFFVPILGWIALIVMLSRPSVSPPGPFDFGSLQLE